MYIKKYNLEEKKVKSGKKKAQIKKEKIAFPHDEIETVIKEIVIDLKNKATPQLIFEHIRDTFLDADEIKINFCIAELERRGALHQ